VDKRVSRTEVAERAGVSKTTVSYVLNGRLDAGIPLATRERVLKAAQELGYTPNRAAQALRTGQTNLVALWMSVLCPIYYARIVSQVQDQLRECGLEMMVTDTATHPDAQTHVNRLAQWPVDGILAFDSAAYVRQFRANFGRNGVPFVSMGVDVDHDVDTVELDLKSGTEEAVRHLIQTGRSRIAFVADRYGKVANEPRHWVYTHEIQAAGLTPEYITVAARSRRSAYEAVRAHVAEHGHPGAVFCFNDDLAIGTHRALLDLGLRMPEDVAVVGHDGTEDTEYLEPRLSSVLVPTEEMCKLAWRFLRNRMDNPELPQQRAVLKTKLIVRDSSALDAGGAA